MWKCANDMDQARKGVTMIEPSRDSTQRDRVGTETPKPAETAVVQNHAAKDGRTVFGLPPGLTPAQALQATANHRERAATEQQEHWTGALSHPVWVFAILLFLAALLLAAVAGLLQGWW